ncbi:hypothetical protein KI387_018780, partial [Taxus chinensis]
MHFGTLGRKRVKDAVRRIGRKWNNLHNLTLGHLGQKVPKYATRVFRPKLEQLALFNFGTFGTKSSEGRDSAGSGENGTTRTKSLGHLEHERAKYAVQGFQPIGEQSALLNLGQLGRKVPTGPKMEQLRGFSADRGIERTSELGT